MTKPTFDEHFWEQLWQKTVREHPNKLAHRPANPHLTAEVADLAPGRALDAGCGHGTEALWLATHGWHVTALDFSAAALAYGRSMADAAGAHIAQRITWQRADLATWLIEPERYDLVVCLHVHIAGAAEDVGVRDDAVEEWVRHLATGVAPGGSLLLVGHRPLDPATGAPTPAANQNQISVEACIAALDAARWRFIIAEERPRSVAGSGVDAVIRAERRR